jgi:hypothetical protein
MSDLYYPGSADRRALPDPADLMAAMFPRRQVTLTVTIDLDPVPGWGDNPEDYRALTQRLLDGAISHYRPTVTIEATS